MNQTRRDLELRFRGCSLCWRFLCLAGAITTPVTYSSNLELQPPPPTRYALCFLVAKEMCLNISLGTYIGRDDFSNPFYFDFFKIVCALRTL